MDKSTSRGAGRTGSPKPLRRAVVASVVVAQSIALIAAYGTPHRVFGWQMFPESSSWQAEIFRVDASGARHDVRETWPGGYSWQGLVAGRLGNPFGRQHAGYGLEATLNLLDEALDWVADHTPLDTSTVRIEAEVTTWPNGRGPDTVRLTSHDRGSGR